jgi:type II secretory pathway pseudopilin PulG
MLVVIGIVILVLSIATPMVTRAWKSGDRTRMAADLQAIAGALEAYRQDHGRYPQVGPAPTGIPEDFHGARMLCRALIGPGPEYHKSEMYIADGKGKDPAPGVTFNWTEPGPGFRTRGSQQSDYKPFTGTVYGPYLKVDQFKIGNPTLPGDSENIPGFLALLDRYNRPILYYSANGKPNVRLPKAFIADWDFKKGAGVSIPMYNVRDNLAIPLTDVAPMLGDLNSNGQIDAAATGGVEEAPAHEGPYVLWSAGPDEQFGPAVGMPRTTPDEVRKAVERSDDVTNFRN